MRAVLDVTGDRLNHVRTCATTLNNPVDMKFMPSPPISGLKLFGSRTANRLAPISNLTASSAEKKDSSISGR